MRESRFEPALSIIAGRISGLVFSDVLVYGILVFVSMMFKLFYTRKILSDSYFYLTIIFYFFRLFPLHELTQLRALLSISLVFAACFLIWMAKPWMAGVACGVAATFH